MTKNISANLRGSSAKTKKAKKTPTQLPEGAERDPRIGYDGPVLGEWGVSGLRRSGGYLLEEFHPNLRGRKADAVYREMADNDPLLGGAYWGMEALVRQVEWRFDAPENSGTIGETYANWFEGARNDMESPWESTVSEIMSMIPYGWAPTEINYKVRRGPDTDEPLLHSKHDDGLIGWRGFDIRAQDSRLRWEYSDAGGSGRLLGMWQQVPTEGRTRFLPIEKMMIFRIRERKRSPEGVSLFRPAYRPYYFGSRAEEFEGIGLERNVAGVLVAELPVATMAANAPQSEKSYRTLAENAVRDFRRDAMSGFVVPCEEDKNGKTGFRLRVLSPEGADVAAADPIIQRYRTDKLVALLMQFLLLGSNQTGSFALSSDMTDLLSTALNAILRIIAKTVNEVAIPRLARLNGFDPRFLPVLNYSDIEKQDTAKLAQALSSALASGLLIADEPLRAWYRQEEGLPAEQGGPLFRLPFGPDGAGPERVAAKHKRPQPRGRRFFRAA